MVTMFRARLAVLCLALMVGVAVLGLYAGCGLTPQKARYNDAEVQKLLRARDEAEAHRFGFTSLPLDAEIRIERTPRVGYDRMLHVRAATSRTIAFRKAGEEYVWIGEQEIFEGPKEYASVDGTSRERIILSYELERISQLGTGTLVISYWGEDPRLTNRDRLTLEEASPVLREWGYDLGQ